MTWESFYLLVFLVGLGLALGSLLLGGIHGAAGHGSGGHVGHGFGGHDFGASGHGAGGHAASGHVHASGQQSSGDEVSPFNLMTISAFLIWFGGAGYILTSVYAWLALMVLGVAIMAGLVGGLTIFLFLAKVLMPGQTRMDPADYKLAGTVGRLSVGIREGGTGEIVYVQGGTRKTLGARNRHGKPIPQGTDVAILEYEKGIAYVEPVDEYIKS